MVAGVYVGESAVAVQPVIDIDITPPGVTVDATSTPGTISAQTGKDTADFYLTSDEDFQAYEIREVTDESSTRASGTLIESGGGGTASSPVALNITAAELAAASVGDGQHRFKVFVQDMAGNWST